MNNNYNGKPRKSNEEYAKIKAAQIAQQTKNLEVINDACEYLEHAISDSTVHKVSMKDILGYLNGEKKYSADETKPISQYNYMLIELANARMNKYISEDRNNIRVLYIQERMKTSFKRELHDQVKKMLETYKILFKWEDTTGKDYTTVMEEKKDNG